MERDLDDAVIFADRVNNGPGFGSFVRAGAVEGRVEQQNHCRLGFYIFDKSEPGGDARPSLVQRSDVTRGR